MRSVHASHALLVEATFDRAGQDTFAVMVPTDDDAQRNEAEMIVNDHLLLTGHGKIMVQSMASITVLEEVKPALRLYRVHVWLVPGDRYPAGEYWTRATDETAARAKVQADMRANGLGEPYNTHAERKDTVGIWLD
jgi:hypothetical protein